MDLLLFDPAEFQRLYNCTAYSVEDVPLGQRKRPILGAIALIAFFSFQVENNLFGRNFPVLQTKNPQIKAMYLPVMIVLRRHLKESCYKMMFCIGLIDIPALFICALLSGIFALQGAVFCSFPILNIVAGHLGMFFWHAETHLAILLALNRLFSLACPALNKFLFAGARTWLCCALVLLYSLAFALHEFPLCWSSLTFSWFFDPHLGYLKMPDNTYENTWDAVESILVACSMPTIYLLYFSFLLRFRAERTISTAADQLLAKIIFTQVFLLSLVNSLEALIYMMMGLFPSIVSPELIIVGTFTWIGIHGLPPIIYLSLNKTLRKECRQMFGGWLANATSIIHPN